MAFVPGHFDGETWIRGHEAPISGIVDHIQKTGRLPNPPKAEEPAIPVQAEDHLGNVVGHIEPPEVNLEGRVENLKGQLDGIQKSLQALLAKRGA